MVDPNPPWNTYSHLSYCIPNLFFIDTLPYWAIILKMAFLTTKKTLCIITTLKLLILIIFLLIIAAPLISLILPSLVVIIMPIGSSHMLVVWLISKLTLIINSIIPLLLWLLNVFHLCLYYINMHIILWTTSHYISFWTLVYVMIITFTYYIYILYYFSLVCVMPFIITIPIIDTSSICICRCFIFFLLRSFIVIII